MIRPLTRTAPPRLRVPAAGTAGAPQTDVTELDEGERNDWFNDAGIVALTCTAAGGLAAFAVWELRGTSRPIVDLRVLATRGVAIGCLVAIVNASIVFGQLLTMPQYLTSVLGFTATQDGLLLALRAIPVVLLAIPVGQIVNRRGVDPRLLIAGGPCLRRQRRGGTRLHHHVP